MINYIEHDGVVVGRDEKSVTVSIATASACAACHAKSACSLSDKKDKIIDIRGHFNVVQGEKVTVIMHKSLGYPAVLLGYVIPLIVVIISLSVMISLKVTEATAGILSLLILIPYYIILRFFKAKIDKKFTFTLKF